MANIPNDLQYTDQHEYVKPSSEPDVYVIGITDYAQDQLGDIVFVELPKVGAALNAHDTFGTIEAVKAVSDLYAPITGEVVDVNAALDNDPSAINRDPYNAGWMIKMRVSGQPTGLLDAAAYGALIGN